MFLLIRSIRVPKLHVVAKGNDPESVIAALPPRLANYGPWECVQAGSRVELASSYLDQLEEHGCVALHLSDPTRRVVLD